MTAQFRFLRVILRNQLHSRTDQHAVTNRDSATVHERAAAIHERVPAESCKTAEIGIKRRHDPSRFIDQLPRQFAHDSPRLCGIMVARIQLSGDAEGPRDQLFYDRVLGIVQAYQLSPAHSFQYIHLFFFSILQVTISMDHSAPMELPGAPATGKRRTLNKIHPLTLLVRHGLLPMMQ